MSRNTVTILSGLAILFAHLHCAVGHGAAPNVCQADQTARIGNPGTSGAMPVPLQNDPHDCDGNFGCICKGATLGIHFAWIDPADFRYLVQPSAIGYSSIHPARFVPGEFPFWQPPWGITALEICAELQSYQL